ncbi:hypothetical protein CCMSSC00406_0007984 [Pleurotus cornucopiae]|uniref:Uncharacterized protein n=1 Tax=Pleurotus cornucopiae TaxID=5321 RepID=A0ACB7IL57_PLECO|nr:hypothetical protein CCMSSC00406_0007984 [Pleurotus cornucopiae]
MLLKVTTFLAVLATATLALPISVLRRDGCDPTPSPPVVVTVATFTASTAFIEDPAATITGLSEGASAYYGVQVEDGQTGYVVILYDDVSQPPIAASDLETLLQSSASPSSAITVRTAHPNGNITGVLFAPLTEITTMDLLPGKTLEELAPVVDELRIMLDGVTGQFGAGHWGEVVEVEGQLKDFVGWESVDEHVRLVSTPEFGAVGGQIVQLASVSSAHVHFTQLV